MSTTTEDVTRAMLPPMEKCPRCGHEEPCAKSWGENLERGRWIQALQHVLGPTRSLTCSEIARVDDWIRPWRDSGRVPQRGER